jgi:hypothetical protein
MTQRKADNRLDFEALRLGIERCDPDLMLGFYAQDAQLSIINAGAPQASRFELRGKAEIAKHLRTVFGPETSHRVEGEDVVSEEWVKFREACEYPDGGRVVVETTLKVRGGKIVRQTDVVAKDARPGLKEEVSQKPPTRKTLPRTHPGVEASPPDPLPHFNQPTDKGISYDVPSI